MLRSQIGKGPETLSAARRYATRYTARIPEVNTMYTSGLLSLEILPEGLVDDLGVGQPVQVSLPPDGLLPALLNKEGDAPGLPACVPDLVECPLALLEPGPHLFHVREQGIQLLHLRILLLFEHLGKLEPLRGRGRWKGSTGEFLQAVTDSRAGHA